MATPRQPRRRPSRRPSREEIERLSEQVQAITRFPDQNPNPVLRISEQGELLYANPASAPVRRALGVEVGESLPTERLEQLWRAAGDDRSVEIEHEHRTFAILPVRIIEMGFVNLYGTDITAKKAIDKFPDENPNPVLRINSAGELIYANAASEPLRAGLGLKLGEQLPPDLLADLRWAAQGKPRKAIELEILHRSFSLLPVPVVEFDFINLYGTEITAKKAIDKFPDQNPNPVLRINAAGSLIYANAASTPIVQAQGLQLGRAIPQQIADAVSASLSAGRRQPLEVSCGELNFELLPVAVPEFDFINLYGTDVTAARLVAQANRENERLLLNILPPPIAERLRRGERIIADRFEDVTLLMADIVGFTTMSSHMSPTEVVAMLNIVFSTIDELVERHGLEKVKTIGDAYMLVGGLPSPVEDHVARVAEMALELTDAIESMPSSAGQVVSVRIGMHCGPAVAGVIGVKKFIYDVWGDTVNIASRMEALGQPGRIQVTHAVQQRLSDQYTFEPRGLIEVKGIGPMPTYFLTGRRAAGRPRGTDVSKSQRPVQGA